MKKPLYSKIEPYLTFLDYQQLERRGADISAQLQEKDKQIQTLVKKQEEFEQLIQSLIDSGRLKSAHKELVVVFLDCLLVQNRKEHHLFIMKTREITIIPPHRIQTQPLNLLI